MHAQSPRANKVPRFVGDSRFVWSIYISLRRFLRRVFPGFRDEGLFNDFAIAAFFWAVSFRAVSLVVALSIFLYVMLTI